MSVVETKRHWPVPNEYAVVCDACGYEVTPDEEPAHLDRDSALEAADLKHDALVREDEQVRCQRCVQKAMCTDGPGTCDGRGLVEWNTSWSGRDPQCDMDAPCPGCVNCEFMDGLVDAKGVAPAEPTSGTKRSVPA